MTVWTQAAPPSAAWDVEFNGDAPRITEDGRRRVTEYGAVRIVERYELSWTPQSPISTPWTQE